MNISQSKSLPIFLALTATLLALYPSLLNDWVNWDDPAYVLNNELVHKFSLKSIGDYFSTLQVQGLYHPLTLLSLAIDYSIAGDEAWIFHLHNILLHLINVIMVFWFIRLLSQNILVAFITACLFGIHPMHVESVAWITGRKDVLYTFYFLAACITYIFYSRHREKQNGLYLLTVLFFILSLLSKGIAVTLPGILLLIDYAERKENWQRMIIEKIPFFILSLIFGVLIIKAQQSGNAMTGLNDLELWDSLFVGSYGFIMYIVKAVFPFHLSAFHPYPYTPDGELPWYIYASIAPLLIIFFLALKTLKSDRNILFGIGFFLVCIAPLIQVLSFGKAILAERYTYVAYIGLFYIAGYLINRFVSENTTPKLLKRMVILLFVLVITTFIWISNNRSQVWQNNTTLWTDVIKKYPDNHLAYCNRASTFAQQDKLEQALSDCNTCINLNPNLSESYNNRGMVYLKLQNPEAALQNFNSALGLNENYIAALGNRAALFMNLGDNTAALKDLSKLIAFNPNDAVTQYNIALVYLRQNNLEAALSAINNAIVLNQDEGLFVFLRSQIYKRLNLEELSTVDLKKAKSLGYPVDNQ